MAGPPPPPPPPAAAPGGAGSPRPAREYGEGGWHPEGSALRPRLTESRAWGALPGSVGGPQGERMERGGLGAEAEGLRLQAQAAPAAQNGGGTATAAGATAPCPRRDPSLRG